MPHATPTPRDLLAEARTIIAKPECWTQGTGARDAAGEPIGVEHQDAVSWCATGALNCAMYRHTDSLEVPPPLQRACERAGAILTATVRALTLGHYTETATYNDTTNHGCILHTFDIAISDAKRLAAHHLD
ncbi:MAG: hypothetical protein OXE50_06520 [Chloroflexi bacterium]|nr:hypothetical protein [Chloroflexota bacterium]